MPDHRLNGTPFAKLYPTSVQKAERKGRIRRLDKMIDELAQGKPLEKILR